MENIILQIIKKSIKISSGMKLLELNKMLYENMSNICLEIMKEILEKADKEIRNSKARKKNWEIVRINKRVIKTVFGELKFERAYYRNRHTHKYAYLLDQTMGIRKYQRIEALLESKVLEHTEHLSFEKSGKLASDSIKLSKQTVKKIVSRFSEAEKDDITKEIKKCKREVKTLYVIADEDHVSLQKDKKKNVLNKIICVYEGKVTECKGRKFLLNKHVFASNIKSSDDLWSEVSSYIETTYSEEKLERIFIMGDGAQWIKKGLDWLDKSTYIIDDFHLNKAILVVAGGKRKKEEYLELKTLIGQKDKKNYLKRAKELIEKSETTSQKERRTKCMNYIVNQWKGIVAGIENRDKYNLGCSAEGLVSHTLASRMSSRPSGWSRKGLEAVTELKIRFSNGMTRDELINIVDRYNKKVEKNRKNIISNIERIKKIVNITLDNMPVLSSGKVSQLSRTISGIRDNRSSFL